MLMVVLMRNYEQKAMYKITLLVEIKIIHISFPFVVSNPDSKTIAKQQSSKFPT